MKLQEEIILIKILLFIGYHYYMIKFRLQSIFEKRKELRRFFTVRNEHK